MTTTVVGAIDSTTAQDDLLNPADPTNAQCSAANGGGCSVRISVTAYGKTLGVGNSFPATVTIRKGPGFGSPPNAIGADTAILIEDKMHYNMGR